MISCYILFVCVCLLEIYRSPTRVLGVIQKKQKRKPRRCTRKAKLLFNSNSNGQTDGRTNWQLHVGVTLFNDFVCVPDECVGCWPFACCNDAIVGLLCVFVAASIWLLHCMRQSIHLSPQNRSEHGGGR